MKRFVEYYKTKSGKIPVKEFIDKLTAKAAQKVFWVLLLLEDIERLPSNYFKKLINTDDIWEVRVSVGKNSYRIFCFFNQSIVVLTHGIIKKHQKISRREIEKAEEYKKDYLRRKNNE